MEACLPGALGPRPGEEEAATPGRLGTGSGDMWGPGRGSRGERAVQAEGAAGRVCVAASGIAPSLPSPSLRCLVPREDSALPSGRLGEQLSGARPSEGGFPGGARPPPPACRAGHWGRQAGRVRRGLAGPLGSCLCPGARAGLVHPQQPGAQQPPLLPAVVQLSRGSGSEASCHPLLAVPRPWRRKCWPAPHCDPARGSQVRQGHSGS